MSFKQPVICAQTSHQVAHCTHPPYLAFWHPSSRRKDVVKQCLEFALCTAKNLSISHSVKLKKTKDDTQEAEGCFSITD